MKRIYSLLRLLFHLLTINTKAALSLRGAFILSSVFMFLNNIIFFVIWIILFSKVDDIRGWQLEDSALIFGLVATSVGLFAVLFGGVLNLARIISEGELDSFMSQPKSVLLTVAASRTQVAGWGDMLSGVLMLYLSGYYSVGSVLMFLLTAISACLIYAASGIIIHSTAFWLGPVNTLARQVHEFLLAFCLYPPSIFTGLLKLLLFTVVPAGFISFVPVRLIKEFTVENLFVVLLSTLFYCLLSILIFGRGVKRYESGSKIVIRG